MDGNRLQVFLAAALLIHNRIIAAKVQVDVVTFVSVTGIPNFYNETLGVMATSAPAMETAVMDANQQYGDLFTMSLTKLVYSTHCSLLVEKVAKIAANYYFNSSRLDSDLLTFATPGNRSPPNEHRS